MASRIPTPSPFANSRSALTLVIGAGPTPRMIALNPAATAALTVLGTLLMGWYLVATLYIVFKDEMLGRLMSQQTEMQHAYEDRLAALRNQIDKVTSRQLLDQNSLEAKMEELLARHAQLETRHALVVALAEQPSAAARPAPARPLAQRPLEPPLATGSIPAFAPPPRPQPTPDAFDLRMPSGRAEPAAQLLRSGSLDGAPPAVVFAELRDAADRIETQQIAALDGIEAQVRRSARRYSDAFAETGLDAARFAPPGAKTAQGGPLVPLADAPRGGFEQRLARATFAVTQAEQIRRIVQRLPVNRPMPPEFEQTSGFGPRNDPFTRAIAMHTGIDFRAPSGSVVRAAGAGKVIEAAWVGGYGNMVEIDHGNGLTTRYAHLSAITVAVGDQVAKGGTVGRVGSTGRSTGPHLHYEARLDGEPMDPSRFIRAGQRLSGR
jgi:murein DD-endopeptidase MepM/ murein hydrolase activator NlpD